MRSVKKLFYTTIALTLTSFLMKTIAVWFNVYLTNLVGSVGIGIFQLIMTVYGLSKTLACSGMNLAATRLCIDDYPNRRNTMGKLFCCAFLLGLFSFLLIYLSSDPISVYWIMTTQASLSLKILSISLPFIALSASLNGYMTAARKMSRYSLIQLLEQLSRIGVTIWIVEKAGEVNIKEAMALICLGITISEVISFLLSLSCFLLDVYKNQLKNQKTGGFFKKMLLIALPDGFGACIRSGLNTVEHLLIPRGIRSSGASVERAFSDYGIVQGMALPILLYPSSILGVISGLLVPEIAECKLKKNEIEVNYIINRVLHVAMIFSMITMSVMLVFADEISLAIYHNTEASYFIRLIAPLIPIMYLDMTTDGMLKGLDLQLSIMKINVLDSLLCVVLVAILVPKVAVDGYIFTIYFAEMVNFILSFRKLAKESKLRFNLMKNVIKPFLGSLIACLFSKQWCQVITKPTPNLIVSISVGLVLYYMILRLCGSITKEDSKWFGALIKP